MWVGFELLFAIGLCLFQKEKQETETGLWVAGRQSGVET